MIGSWSSLPGTAFLDGDVGKFSFYYKIVFSVVGLTLISLGVLDEFALLPYTTLIIHTFSLPPGSFFL